MATRAVLLANLGSPDSTDVADVRRYLEEFLGDERVIDKPDWAPLRRFIVNQIICRFRAPKSAEAYKSIWTEAGSPLIVTSEDIARKVAAALGADAAVYLAMRYRKPSIASVLERMKADGIEEVLLFPQYPHYAMSSWETVVVEVRKEAARIAPGLKIDCVQPFYRDADYIEALYAVAKPYLDAHPECHVLFSYHGIPERHLRKADSSHAHCTFVDDCCHTCSPAHATCYRAQITQTTQTFARRAGLPESQYNITFQSRLGKEPWLQPYTDETLRQLPARGIKNLLVMTPAFMGDCLETLEEIAVEGREIFLQAGGRFFQHVPCLNASDPAIDFFVNRTRAWLDGATPAETQIEQRYRALSLASA